MRGTLRGLARFLSRRLRTVGGRLVVARLEDIPVRFLLSFSIGSLSSVLSAPVVVATSMLYVRDTDREVYPEHHFRRGLGTSTSCWWGGGSTPLSESFRLNQSVPLGRPFTVPTHLEAPGPRRLMKNDEGQ